MDNYGHGARFGEVNVKQQSSASEVDAPSFVETFIEIRFCGTERGPSANLVMQRAGDLPKLRR